MRFKTFLFFVFACLVPGHVLAALVIDQDVTDNGYYHWSGAHRFDVDEATIDNQLPSLAMQAYEAMMRDINNKNIDQAYIPNVMAALAVNMDGGFYVYFSSSMKGISPFLINPRQSGDEYPVRGVAEEVAVALIRCQHTYQKDHRFEAKCGEPLAIQQFLANNPQQSVIRKGKISSYGGISRRDPNNVASMNPCRVNEDGEWGCDVFLQKLSVQTLGQQGSNPGLPSIEPAEQLPHCFWNPPHY